MPIWNKLLAPAVRNQVLNRWTIWDVAWYVAEFNVMFQCGPRREEWVHWPQGKGLEAERECISLFHKWIKKTSLSRLHCQRTHYYPAQPAPLNPRKLWNLVALLCEWTPCSMWCFKPCFDTICKLPDTESNKALLQELNTDWANTN